MYTKTSSQRFHCSLISDIWLAKTISVSATESELFRVDRDPRKHSTSDLISDMLILTRTKYVASLTVTFRFSASFSASRLKKNEHSRLIPPKQENTNGVNDPWSTSNTRFAYLTFFSFSWISWTLVRGLERWHLANGLKTLISQNALCPRIQKPLAATSNRASFSIFVVLALKTSPVISWRSGSSSTSRQTSLRNSAVIRLSSLCTPV